MALSAFSTQQSGSVSGILVQRPYAENLRTGRSWDSAERQVRNGQAFTGNGGMQLRGASEKNLSADWKLRVQVSFGSTPDLPTAQMT